MGQEQINSTSEMAREKSLRPVLIISEQMVYEYSIFLEHLLVGLAGESIPVALVCHPDSDVDFLVSPGVEVIRYPALRLPLMKRQNRKILAEQLAKFRPTVLHCLCQSEASLTRKLAKQLDLSYVLTVNSLQERWGQFPISLKRCAKIIVPTKTIADNFAKFYPRFVNRVEQINVGTFVADSTACFRDPSRLASMVTSHLLDDAGVFENLFGAVRHLAIDGYEFMLVVIGGGRAEKELRKLLTAQGLSQIITIVPRLKSWRSVFAAGDIFIQPGPTSMFNPLLLEAMAVGAAVASCKGGVDDLIIDGQTAVVFDPADELSIYASLQRLLDSRQFARQIASRAQQHLKQNHTVTKMVSAILQAYSDAQDW